MIGIIGAMEDEVKLLRSHMEHPQTRTKGGIEFNKGKLEGKDVVLLRCGIGKVNSAVGSTLLIEEYNPEFIINTGSAGGIDPSLNFGDAIISSGLIYHDVDLTALDFKPGQIPGCPVVFPVKEELIKQAERAIDGLKGEKILPQDFNCVRGLLGSGDIFMYEPERIEAILGIFPDIKAVEMEGAAIAHVCFLFDIPSLFIRALSDIAGIESPYAFETFLPIASKHSSEIVRRIVRDYS